MRIEPQKQQKNVEISPFASCAISYCCEYAFRIDLMLHMYVISSPSFWYHLQFSLRGIFFNLWNVFCSYRNHGICGKFIVSGWCSWAKIEKKCLCIAKITDANINRYFFIRKIYIRRRVVDIYIYIKTMIFCVSSNTYWKLILSTIK